MYGRIVQDPRLMRKDVHDIYKNLKYSDGWQDASYCCARFDLFGE